MSGGSQAGPQPPDAPGVVVVTGGSRGLGLAVARTLAGAGHEVVAVARQEGPELPAAREKATPGALHFAPCDLAELDALPGFVRGLRRAFGPIWALVNNAGLGTPGMLATMRDAEIERLVRVNLTAPMILTKYVVRTMMAAGRGGRIVSMGSILGSTGFSGLSAYGATKAALEGFTRSLAREVGPLGITANLVAPGFVATSMTEGLEGAQRDQVVRRSALRRLPEPDDVAAAVAYLLGPGGRNVTGTVLTVDAGSTA